MPQYQDFRNQKERNAPPALFAVVSLPLGQAEKTAITEYCGHVFIRAFSRHLNKILQHNPFIYADFA